MASKPDAYDFCFGCEFCVNKQFGLWRESVCMFGDYDDSKAIDRIIKRLERCPKEKDGEQE